MFKNQFILNEWWSIGFMLLQYLHSLLKLNVAFLMEMICRSCKTYGIIVARYAREWPKADNIAIGWQDEDQEQEYNK